MVYPLYVLGLVFPVYAGVILTGGGIMITILCVPRVCGGDPE